MQSPDGVAERIGWIEKPHLETHLRRLFVVDDRAIRQMGLHVAEHLGDLGGLLRVSGAKGFVCSRTDPRLWKPGRRFRALR